MSLCLSLSLSLTHTHTHHAHTHTQEMDILEEDATVYKLIGPVLVKQDLSEAKQTVEKRLDYISKEMYAYCACCTDA